jgi:very-short-patch-repair endonuclease
MESNNDSYQPITARSRLEKQAIARKMCVSMTPAEAVLWSRLRHNRLRDLHFRRQVIIEGFVVDFYCHEFRLIIEVDGAVHDLQVEYDTERTTILMERGFRVVRLSNQDVLSNLRVAMLRIVTALELP